MDSAQHAALVPLSLLLMSLAWCPKVSKLQLEPRGGFRDTVDDDTIVENGTPGTHVDTEQANMDQHHKTARGKSTIISSFLKMLLTPFIAAGFCAWYDVADISSAKLKAGFEDFTVHHPSFNYFMAQIFTSLLGYLLGWLACGMRLQRWSFALPLTLTTPLAMTVVLVPGKCDW